MQNNQIQSYQTTPTEGNPRHSEAWALAQAAIRMSRAVQDKNDEELHAAVRLNWRLWTILQSDVIGEDCPLPIEIRNNMLSLCNFVDKHSVAFFADPSPSKIDVLVNINRQLSGGLYETPASASAQDQTSASVQDSPPDAPSLPSDLEA